MEDTTGFEETPSGPAAIMEAVKKFGIGKLLLVIIVLAALLWFFVLAPKPGTVTVHVKELDSGNPMDGVEIDLTPGTQKPMQGITSPSGTVSFSNVPSGVDISIDVLPPSTHQISGDVPATFQLTSGGEKNIPITLSQVSNLKIKAIANKMSLGTSCNSGLDVTVQNAGTQAANVHLIGSGDLKDDIQSDPFTLNAGASKTITMNVTGGAKVGTASGKIRAEFTDNGDAFTLDTTDPEQLQINPSQFSEHMAPGSPYSSQFTVGNNGRNTEASLLPVSITGDFTNYNAKATYADDTPLKAGQSKILTLTFTAPSDPGTTHGVMIVSSACQIIQVPLELTVDAPRS